MLRRIPVVLLLMAAMTELGNTRESQTMAALENSDRTIPIGKRMESTARRDPVCLPGDPCGPGRPDGRL